MITFTCKGLIIFCSRNQLWFTAHLALFILTIRLSMCLLMNMCGSIFTEYLYARGSYLSAIPHSVWNQFSIKRILPQLPTSILLFNRRVIEEYACTIQILRPDGLLRGDWEDRSLSLICMWGESVSVSLLILCTYATKIFPRLFSWNPPIYIPINYEQIHHDI